MTRLEWLRRERRWTRHELTLRSRLTTDTIGRLERREHFPSSATLERLARALMLEGTEMRALMDEVDGTGVVVHGWAAMRDGAARVAS